MWLLTHRRSNSFKGRMAGNDREGRMLGSCNICLVPSFAGAFIKQNYRDCIGSEAGGQCDYNHLIQVLMASELRLKRLTNQFDEALQAFEDDDEEKMDPAVRAIIPANTNGKEDLSDWTIIFEGKEYSNLVGGNYKMRVLAGETYPYEPPEVWMLDNFEHFHVFTGGKVCFKLLNKENWKLGYSILMLVNSIIKMLHSDPELSDPASTNLTKLVERKETRYHQPSLTQYNSFLRAQANRFESRYEAQILYFCSKYGFKPRKNQQRQEQMDVE